MENSEKTTREQLIDKMMMAWATDNAPVAKGEQMVETIKDSADIAEQCSGIIDMTNDEVSFWLYAAGYHIVSIDGNLYWQVFVEKEE